MDYYKRVLELAGDIRDPGLRKKVMEILKHPSLSNRNFKYKGVSMREAPASLAWHHVQTGGLAKHTYIVASLCMKVADIVDKNYDQEIDRDTLLAGALLHDIAKLFDLKRDGRSFDSTDLSIDHIIMGSAELYARGFPEPVIHLIASHFGEQGTTSPQTVEAVILHHADTLSAIIGTSKAHKLMQLLSQ